MVIGYFVVLLRDIVLLCVLVFGCVAMCSGMILASLDFPAAFAELCCSVQGSMLVCACKDDSTDNCCTSCYINLRLTPRENLITCVILLSPWEIHSLNELLKSCTSAVRLKVTIHLIKYMQSK